MSQDEKVNSDKAAIFLEHLLPFVDNCVEIMTLYRKVKTEAGKRLKDYKTTIGILEKELKAANRDPSIGTPKIDGNIKAFRKLGNLLDSIVANMAGGDYDDTWLRMKSNSYRIIYVKAGDQEVHAIAIYLSDIYSHCHTVIERYNLLSKLFSVLQVVSADKETTRKLKKVVVTYTKKLGDIPEEEIILCKPKEKGTGGEDSDSDDADGGSRGRINPGQIKGLLKEVGLTDMLSDLQNINNKGDDDAEGTEASDAEGTEEGSEPEVKETDKREPKKKR